MEIAHINLKNQYTRHNSKAKRKPSNTSNTKIKLTHHSANLPRSSTYSRPSTLTCASASGPCSAGCNTVGRTLVRRSAGTAEPPWPFLRLRAELSGTSSRRRVNLHACGTTEMADKGEPHGPKNGQPNPKTQPETLGLAPKTLITAPRSGKRRLSRQNPVRLQSRNVKNAPRTAYLSAYFREFQVNRGLCGDLKV